jgi:hypothetical protein
LFKLRKCFQLSAMLAPACLSAKPYVTAHLMGQFGNQIFIMAAAISLALDNNAEFTFPDLASESNDPIFNIPTNYAHVFYHLDANEPSEDISYIYKEKNFTYDPIPFQDNMSLFGWFQSEKYFRNHKDEIVSLFSPNEEILGYLNAKYGDILRNPKSVAIHMRSYQVEKTAEQRSAYVTYGREYIEKAMALFPEDSLFVVFSNDMKWCKQELEGIPRTIRFIEGEAHYHDFYLMSQCQHQIICNSSFSWWAAYLNTNPDKLVVVPPQWFSKEYVRDTRDLIPSEWCVLNE